MTEEELYAATDVPPVENVFAHCYRILVKIVFMIMFGIGSFILAVTLFPLMRIFIRPRKRFQAAARSIVSSMFRGMNFLLSAFGIFRVYVDEIEKFKSLKSKIVVSNHPAMFDSVQMMALVPNSTCIFRGNLQRGPLGALVSQIYIPNSTPFDEMCRLCKETLDMGSNVVIFPEGTRSPRRGEIPYKKGAARIARYAGADIQVVFIGGSDKYGLGKHNPIASFNHVEPIVYDFKFMCGIKIDDYKDLPNPIAAKRITKKIREEIVRAGTQYEKSHPRCKTTSHF